jgi:hypothetical protein
MIGTHMICTDIFERGARVRTRVCVCVCVRVRMRMRMRVRVRVRVRCCLIRVLLCSLCRFVEGRHVRNHESHRAVAVANRRIFMSIYMSI